MPTRILVVVVLASLLGACSSFGSNSSSRQSSGRIPQAASASVTVEIESEHIRLIRAYYGDGSQSRGRGRRGLPPGIAKNLQRGKPLPPGIAMQMLPDDIIGELPRLPSGYGYVVAAGKLLLIDLATHVVQDVLVEVLFG